MEVGTFSLVPIEVVRDKRLTLEQMRVLIALFSFRSKATNTIWPSRQAISKRCGVHPSNVSAATTALERLGWLRKDGNGGRSKASSYTLCVPDLDTNTVAQQATVADSATVAQQATKTVAQQATKTVAQQAMGKEHTNEHTKEHTNIYASVAGNDASALSGGATGKKSATDVSRPSCVSTQVWADFIAHRKAKRAPVTQSAIDLIAREAEKAGVSLEEALKTCCAMGWQGFRADWFLRDRQPAMRAAPIETYGEREEARKRRLYEEMAGRRPAATVIDVGAVDAIDAVLAVPGIGRESRTP